MITMILRVAGLLLTADGFLNFAYWRRRPGPHHLLFQLGRLVRGLAGLTFTLCLDAILAGVKT